MSFFLRAVVIAWSRFTREATRNRASAIGDARMPASAVGDQLLLLRVCYLGWLRVMLERLYIVLNIEHQFLQQMYWESDAILDDNGQPAVDLGHARTRGCDEAPISWDYDD